MKLNGLYLDATPEQIIQKLTFELEEEQGRFLFRRTKSLGSNMQFSCPFHGDGMERHPSCGMSRDVSYSGSRIIEAGTVHCFTCGYTAKLNEFVSDLFNMSYPSAKILGEHLNLANASATVRVLDVAAGSGVWGITLAQQSKWVHVTAQDWPGVLPVTRQHVERGVTPRGGGGGQCRTFFT